MSPRPTVLTFLSSLVRISAISVTVVGLGVLLGWLFNNAYLKSVARGLASMKANTAFAFVATGGALWLLRTPERTRRERLTGRLLAALVGRSG